MARKKEPLLYEMDYNAKMDFIRMRVQSVIQGYKNAILIMGSAGIGKTTVILDELNETIKHNDKFQNYNIIEFNGKISQPKSFFKLLSDNNDSKNILLFDDCNDLLDRNSKSVDIVRSACGESKIRDVYFTDSEITPTSKKYKSHLKLRSKIIFISNLTESKLQESLYSRLNPYEIVIEPQELLDYIENNLTVIKPTQVPLGWKKEVIAFIKKENLIKSCKHFDFRIFFDLVLFRAASKIENDWKTYVYALMQKGIRKKM